MAETKENKEWVNHPAHYNRGKYETIDVIEDWNLNFSLGSVIKYISRCGAKDDPSMTIEEKSLEDLKKARFYLDREIQRREKEK